jgi:hypothetical protein
MAAAAIIGAAVGTAMPEELEEASEPPDWALPVASAEEEEAVCCWLFPPAPAVTEERMLLKFSVWLASCLE